MSKQKGVIPKELYIVSEEKHDGSTYLVTHEHPSSAAKINRNVEVWVYQFVRKAKVKNNSELV